MKNVVPNNVTGCSSQVKLRLRVATARQPIRAEERGEDWPIGEESGALGPGLRVWSGESESVYYNSRLWAVIIIISPVIMIPGLPPLPPHMAVQWRQEKRFCDFQTLTSSILSPDSGFILAIGWSQGGREVCICWSGSDSGANRHLVIVTTALARLAGCVWSDVGPKD